MVEVEHRAPDDEAERPGGPAENRRVAWRGPWRRSDPQSDLAARHRPPSARFRAGLSLLTLIAVTAIGAAIRYKGFTSYGLWRDDAWAVLSSRVGIGTAWHMWVTAPGFYFVERTLVVLGPSGTWWTQVFPFVAGVACIPASYFLTRYFRFSRGAALIVAVLVAVSPVCATYSTRVKEFPVDFLMSCLLIAVAERARRKPSAPLLALGLSSVFAFLVSASLGPAIVALWLALGFSWFRAGVLGRRVVLAGAATAAGCAVVAAVFYTHISPQDAHFWDIEGVFIVHSSLDKFFLSVHSSAWNLLQGLFGFAQLDSAGRVLIVVGWVVLSVVGLYRNPPMYGPALMVVAGFTASAAHIAPLGVGRSDEYLYPAILLILTAGVFRGVALLQLHLHALPRAVTFASASVVAVAVVILAGALLHHEYVDAPVYPGEDVAGIATALNHLRQPGDVIFVSEEMRYPWALYTDQTPHIEFGPNWATGFTVVSTQPDVFIAPSEPYEGGSQPVAWARSMRRYRRLWFVNFYAGGYLSPSYYALLADGWHQVSSISRFGSAAVLFERSGAIGSHTVNSG